MLYPKISLGRIVPSCDSLLFPVDLGTAGRFGEKRLLFALATTATAAHDAGGPFSTGFSYYASAGMKKELIAQFLSMLQNGDAHFTTGEQIK